MQPMVLGIAGGSGAGKSTLVASVRRRLHCASTVLGFDSYYNDQSHLDPDLRRLVNYDHPDALDAKRFATDVAALKRNEAIEVPIYDYANYTSGPAVEVVLPQPVVIVDGILLLAFPEIREVLDVAVYLSVPATLRFERRLARDVVERGRTPASVASQFEATVAPMHEEFVEPSARHADVIVSGSDDLVTKTNVVLALLPQNLHATALH